MLTCRRGSPPRRCASTMALLTPPAMPPRARSPRNPRRLRLVTLHPGEDGRPCPSGTREVQLIPGVAKARFDSTEIEVAVAQLRGQAPKRGGAVSHLEPDARSVTELDQLVSERALAHRGDRDSAAGESRQSRGHPPLALCASGASHRSKPAAQIPAIRAQRDRFRKANPRRRAQPPPATFEQRPAGHDPTSA